MIIHILLQSLPPCFETLLEPRFWYGKQPCRRISHYIFSWLKTGPIHPHLQFGKKAKRPTEPCRVRWEPYELEECCIWWRKPESKEQNGRVRYPDGTVKVSLLPVPAVCTTQYHECNGGPPSSALLWWFRLVMCTHNGKQHRSQSKRLTWLLWTSRAFLIWEMTDVDTVTVVIMVSWSFR